MANNKKGGLIGRLISGSEKSEGYARASLPSNRWGLFFDIFKGQLRKLVLINLLVLIFFIPIAAVIVFYVMAVSGYGGLCPYASPFGAGYQAAPSFEGFSEGIITGVNVQVLSLLPAVAIFASIGLAGGAYVIRNMIWTEGIFVANDFWRGVKQNFISVAVISVLYSTVFVLSVIAISYVNQFLAYGEGIRWLLITFRYLIIIAIVLFSIMALHMITMTVNYRLKFRNLFKNAIIFTVGMLPQNLFFALIAFIPVILVFLGGFFMVIGLLLVILIGFSFALLVWADFCQWAYDEFINSKIPSAKKNRGIYEKVGAKDSAAVKKYKEQLSIYAMSENSLSSKPIKPITDEELKLADLPQSFNREDIAKLNDSRRVLYEDNANYVKEHEKEFADKRAVAYEAVKEDVIAREKRIARAKKELEKREKEK